MSRSIAATSSASRRSPGPWLLSVMAAACFVAVAAGSPGMAAVVGPGPAPACQPTVEEDVWAVSTRRLPCIAGLPSHVVFDVERRVAGRWERSDVDALLADPARPLVFFIHGNRYEAGEARSQGVTFARRLAANEPASVRTVVFSWPSQQRGRLIDSSRENYRRASADGHYLAWLLGRVPQTQPVAIVGYSLGGLIAAEALDDLVKHPEAVVESPWVSRAGRVHLVLVAPAMRCDALAPRGAYGAATSGIQRLTLVINSRDLALRMFPHLDRETNLDALGVAGMSRRAVPATVEFSATDAAPVVGRRHAFPEYLQSGGLMRRISTGAVSGLAAD